MNTALRIVGIYTLAGLLWVYFSERYLTIDAYPDSFLQYSNGYIFVLATAILLFFIIRRYSEMIDAKNKELQEKEKLEHKFNQVEARFNAFADYSEDLILMLDESDNVFYKSPNFKRILGCTPTASTLTEVITAVHADDFEKIKNTYLETVINPGKTFPLQFRLKYRKQEWVWVEGTATNLLNIPNVKAIIVHFRDITRDKLAIDRIKESEESLRLSNEYYRLVLKATHDTIWNCDIVTGDIQWNDGLEHVFGYNEKLAKYDLEWWKTSVHEEDSARVLKKIEYHENEKYRFWEDNYRFRCADGSYRFVVDKGYIVYDENGKAMKMIGAMQDVSALKENELLLAELNKSLQLKANQLAGANEELERFAYVASHDLQEPLRMVTSFLYLLQKNYEDRLDDTAQQYIHFAVDASERMKKLIQDLLEYSRTGTLNHEKVPVDLNEVMDIVKKNHMEISGEESGFIECDELPSVMANKTQMIQLFQNIVGNGFKYIAKGTTPHIKIKATDQGTHWHFSIKDNGIGIQAEHLNKVFDAFKRLHTQSQYKGSGIGLAICRKIVEKHNGQIWVESKYGKGSDFQFTIKK